MAFSPDMSHFGVGLADGTVTVTKNKEKERKIEIMDDSAFLLNASSNEEAMTYKYFFRGIYDKRSKVKADDVIEQKKGIRLAKYDSLLK